MKIMGASIGSCVHNVGLLNFLNLAKQNGCETVYVGAAIAIEELVELIEKHEPDMVALSYRLGAEALKNLLTALESSLKERKLLDKIYVFGGTVETAEVAKGFSFIKKTFDGTEELDEIVMFLRGEVRKTRKMEVYPQKLGERIKFKSPFPLIRHHIGLQTLNETMEEIKKMAESELLDVISIAPDQNCQQFFFEPEKWIQSRMELVVCRSEREKISLDCMRQAGQETTHSLDATLARSTWLSFQNCSKKL